MAQAFPSPLVPEDQGWECAACRRRVLGVFLDRRGFVCDACYFERVRLAARPGPQSGQEPR